MSDHWPHIIIEPPPPPNKIYWEIKIMKERKSDEYDKKLYTPFHQEVNYINLGTYLYTSLHKSACYFNYHNHSYATSVIFGCLRSSSTTITTTKTGDSLLYTRGLSRHGQIKWAGSSQIIHQIYNLYIVNMICIALTILFSK